jgi:hypothetical protein
MHMGKQAESPLDEVDADFLTSEIHRLLFSAKLRIEQQRIHIAELSGSIAERTRARHELRAMVEMYEKLDAYRRRFAR